MSFRFTKVRRITLSALALAVAAVPAVPALVGDASAAGQVASRSVQLSSSLASATSSKYTVTFTPATAGTIGGIVVDFCGDSPIIGSTTCTLPTGFTLGSSVTLTAGYTGMGTGWATTSSAQGGAAAGQKQVAILTNTTPQSVTTSTPVSFELTGITNPSASGTFYARIYTFDTSSNTTTNYTTSGTTRAANPTGKVDYGGAAMAITNAVNITAIVQEQLTFCVSDTAPGTGCSTNVNAPSLTLGSGTPKVLGTALSTANAYDQITSNANGNVKVRLKTTSSTACAGLSRDNGTTCGIGAIGTLAAITTGAGKFGVSVADGTGGTGTVNADPAYKGSSTYAMQSNVVSDYGDVIQTSAGATTDVNSTLTYAANAAATTPAGVYTTTHSLIATGTY